MKPIHALAASAVAAVGALAAAGAIAATGAIPAPAAEPVKASTPIEAAAPAKAAGSSGDTSADASLYWYDGGRRRALQVDGSQLADFRRAAKDTLRPSGDVEKSPSGTLPDGVSQVLREAGAAPGDARALPGGVIVTLQTAPPGGDAAARESQARALLQAQGLAPVRALDPGQRTWLLEAPPGIASLELANRLHEGGAFESVEPNWWRPRALK